MFLFDRKCRLNSDCNFGENCQSGRCVKRNNVDTTSRPPQCALPSDCPKRKNTKGQQFYHQECLLQKGQSKNRSFKYIFAK